MKFVNGTFYQNLESNLIIIILTSSRDANLTLKVKEGINEAICQEGIEIEAYRAVSDCIL